MLSFYALAGNDPVHITAYVVAGIGFIGAGTIIQARERAIGVTTAASLWVASSVGTAAVIDTGIAYVTLKLRWIERKLA
jgi:putative Mg2+ transporter-C (MgtC) family protein